MGVDGVPEEPEALLLSLLAVRQERDDLHSQLERLNERHRTLDELMKWAVGVEDPQTIAGPMLDVCMEAIPALAAGVYLADGAGAVALVASAGAAAPGLPAQLSPEVLLAARAASPERKVHEPDLAYEYAVPISQRGKLVGVIIVRRAPSRPLDGDELRFVYGVASALATAVAVWAADKQLRDVAMHDSLTGLPNRRFLVEHLQRALARSARAGASVAVFFMDLDDFKQVNDSLGHRAGDEVLVASAQRLTSAVRAGDLVARLAGDEFIAVVESVDAGTVEAVTTRLGAAFAEPFRAADTHVVVHASIGVALGGPGLTGDAILALADDAMYVAKAAKRAGLDAQ